MKNATRKVTLVLVALMMVLSLVLTACQDINDDTDKVVDPDDSSNVSDVDTSTNSASYSIYVKNSANGYGLSSVHVTVKSLDKEIAQGSTNRNGKFTFTADLGEYDVIVTNLPLGYSLNTNNTYRTSADEDTLTILATSSVIKDTVPSDKVYWEGDIAYDFTITDATDRDNVKTYNLSEVLETKKMVLLNFWNTKCIPCMDELPDLELAYKEYQDVAEVFGINVPLLGDDTWSNVRNTKSMYSLTFPLTIDDNNLPYHFKLQGIPVTVIIDRYGAIVYQHEGQLSKSEFVSLFEKYTADDYVPD